MFDTAKKLLLHLFFPNRCPFCKACISYNAHCCATCAPKIASKTIVASGTIMGTLQHDGIYTRFSYEDCIASAIRHLKFHGFLQYAAHFGYYLAEIIPENDRLPLDLVTYIPMHPKKQRRRGFNQAHRIAKAVAKEKQLPLCNTLEKLHETPEQHTLNKIKRRDNLAGSFAVISPQLVCGQHILLVDDVYTTGQTTKLATGLLTEAGAKSVSIATVAKVLRLDAVMDEPHLAG